MFTIPDQEFLARFIGKTLKEASQIVGEIYKIRCKTTGRSYVGQTVSHVQNRGKIRPAGYVRRVGAHFTEAKHDKRGFQCTYLNNAIRKYGDKDFEVELIMRCPREDMDAWEIHWIDKLETLAPSGYNLTQGGKVFLKESVQAEDMDKTFVKTARNAPKSPEAIAKWSASSKAFYATKEGFESMSTRVQKFNLEKNIRKYQDINLSASNEKYIRCSTNKDGIVDGVTVYFSNHMRIKYKRVTEEEGIRRATDFLNQLRKHQANIKAKRETSKLTGTP